MVLHSGSSDSLFNAEVVFFRGFVFLYKLSLIYTNKHCERDWNKSCQKCFCFLASENPTYITSPAVTSGGLEVS